jgi:hypothetical protein
MNEDILSYLDPQLGWQGEERERATRNVCRHCSDIELSVNEAAMSFKVWTSLRVAAMFVREVDLGLSIRTYIKSYFYKI